MAVFLGCGDMARRYDSCPLPSSPAGEVHICLAADPHLACEGRSEVFNYLLFVAVSVLALRRPVFGFAFSDVVLAGALTVFALLDVLLSPDWRGPTVVNVVAVPSMAATLMWRRRRPLVPLATVAVILVLLGATYGSSQAWTMVFVTSVAVYSAAAHSPRLPAVVALSIVAAVAHTVFDPLVQAFGEAMFSSSLTGLALLAGLSGRQLGNRSKALDTIAADLEREEAARAQAAAAEERQRIARELHDIISHSLSVLVLQAGAAEASLDRNPAQVRDVLRSMRRTGQEAIGEMSTLLGLIRPDTHADRAPQPSLRELDELVASTRAAGLPVSIEVSVNSGVLSAAVELSIYRVVQESLTNVLKHAPGARTKVRIGRDERTVEVVVDNEPCPIHAARGPGTRHGLAGLAERLSVFGGHLQAGPQPGGGWRVHASFPVSS